MAKRERSITQHDIEAIVDIIRRMRTTPTWPKLAEKVAAAGLPFKQRALQNHGGIVDAYQAKRAEIAGERTAREAERKHQGLPSTEDGMRELIATLRDRVAELEAENGRLKEATETLLYNAEKLNVPRTNLTRPLASKR